MEFLTLPFVALFGVTLLLYYVCCSKAWQHAILLIASSIFIGYYHWQYLVVALGITLFTFYMGKAIHRYLNSRTATYLFLFSVIGLAGFWLFSRYWSGMFPIGISFYTFQALSYLIEIYWEEEPEDSLPDFMLYMLLFMKFLSGPIERGFDLLPQLKEGKIFNYTGVTRGLKLVAWGCFLKLVIADRIAAPLATVLDHLPTSSGMQILFATLLYPLQLYADFAGYTCMAIGMGRMLGFTLQRNFDRPFISQSTGELWRRWHMPLSFWVRDYICSNRCMAWCRLDIRFIWIVSGHIGYLRNAFQKTARAVAEQSRGEGVENTDDYSHIRSLCIFFTLLPWDRNQ